jgi:hypothetical protein
VDGSTRVRRCFDLRIRGLDGGHMATPPDAMREGLVWIAS